MTETGPRMLVTERVVVGLKYYEIRKSRTLSSSLARNSTNAACTSWSTVRPIMGKRGGRSSTSSVDGEKILGVRKTRRRGGFFFRGALKADGWTRVSGGSDGVFEEEREVKGKEMERPRRDYGGRSCTSNEALRNLETGRNLGNR